MLIGTTIASVVGLMFYSSARTMAPRLDLQGAADRATFLITRARLEAIQRGVPTVVQVDLAHGEFRVFADVNGDSVAGSSGFDHYLKFDPYWLDGVHRPDLGPKQTDYEVGFLRLERSIFAAPGGKDAVTGFTKVPGALPDAPPVLVFSPDGVPKNLGTFRLADQSGFDGRSMNHIEIAIVNLTGRVETRKYLHEDDSPTSSAGFFSEGLRSSGENLWVWY